MRGPKSAVNALAVGSARTGQTLIIETRDKFNFPSTIQVALGTENLTVETAEARRLFIVASRLREWRSVRPQGTHPGISSGHTALRPLFLSLSLSLAWRIQTGAAPRRERLQTQLPARPAGRLTLPSGEQVLLGPPGGQEAALTSGVQDHGHGQ